MCIITWPSRNSFISQTTMILRNSALLERIIIIAPLLTNKLVKVLGKSLNLFVFLPGADEHLTEKKLPYWNRVIVERILNVAPTVIRVFLRMQWEHSRDWITVLYLCSSLLNWVLSLTSFTCWITVSSLHADEVTQQWHGANPGDLIKLVF